jgi:hypothetical protein
VACSPEYGLRRLRAPKLTGGGAKEREEHGEFGSGGGVATGRWREEVTRTRWGGVPTIERRREGLGEV